jgi:hypothetical protein
VLLLGWGAWPGDAPAAGAAVRRLGWLLAVGGVLLYPLAALMAGRAWTQLEVFGITPEPTALATLGLLLASAQPPARVWRCVLLIIPVLSLLVGAATLWLIAGG